MKLIKLTEEHYIIVDETIQPVNGYYYDDFIKAIRNTSGAEYGEANHCWQITHSTDINFNEVYYISLQEVKELIGEVDVEKKVKEYYKKDTTLNNPSSFKAGYNQALEDNKDKKYTEENMKKAIEFGYDLRNNHKPINSGIDWVKILSQSLQPKTEWEVEIVDDKLKLK